MEKHDELGVHGDTDVVGEFRHHAALHLGFAVGVWKTCGEEASPRWSTAAV